MVFVAMDEYALAVLIVAAVPFAVPSELVGEQVSCFHVVLVAVERVIPVQGQRASLAAGLDARSLDVGGGKIFGGDGLTHG